MIKLTQQREITPYGDLLGSSVAPSIERGGVRTIAREMKNGFAFASKLCRGNS
jgi:hypothetical protein